MSAIPNPQNQAELLSLIQREWLALMAVVAKLSPEQMVTPDAGGWSPKDNLAHLTVWLKALLGHHFEHRSAEEVLGIPKGLAENFDFERVNAYTVEHSRRQSTDDILYELRQKYAEVVARLTSMPFEDLLQPRYADDPEKHPLLEWVLGNTSEHFAEHRATIEKVLA
jgi:hypothetical protein